MNGDLDALLAEPLPANLPHAAFSRIIPVMQPLTLWLIALTALPAAASAEPSAVERLGTVSFSVSCSPAVGVPCNRRVGTSCGAHAGPYFCATRHVAGGHAYYADSTGAQIQRGDMRAWIAFAQGNATDAITLSPNRFNGLFHAGMAAEAVGDKAKAKQYYEALLKSTDNGAQSARPEFDHVKVFFSSTALALQ